MFYTIIALVVATMLMFPAQTKSIYFTYFLPLMNKWKMYIYNYLVSFLKNYLMDVINSEELNNSLQNVLKGQLNRLLEDEELRAQMITKLKRDAQVIADDTEMNSYIHEIIQKQLESSDTSPRTRAAIAKLLKNQSEILVKEEWFEKEIKEQITKLLVATCESTEVKDKLRELLERLNNDLVERGEINKQLNDLLVKIINDPEFMKNAGSGIRKTLRHTLWGMWGTYPDADKDNKDKFVTVDRSEHGSELYSERSSVKPSITVINDKGSEKTDKSAESLKVSITKNRSNSLGSSGLGNGIGIGSSGIIENPRMIKRDLEKDLNPEEK